MRNDSNAPNEAILIDIHKYSNTKCTYIYLLHYISTLQVYAYLGDSNWRRCKYHVGNDFGSGVGWGRSIDW